MIRWLIQKIWALWNDWIFRVVVGFWPSEVVDLYIKLISRDDEEWSSINVGGFYFIIKNSAIIDDRADCIAIGGDYDGAKKFTITYGKPDTIAPDVVITYPYWQRKYALGRWQKTIKHFIKEYK